MLALFVIGCSLIYVLRDYLLLIIYSKQFLAASDLMLPQLVGDTIKVSTLLLYYYFMSRGRVLIVFFAELVLGVALIALYLVMVPSYGMTAPIYAYAVACSAVLFIMLGLLLFTNERLPWRTS